MNTNDLTPEHNARQQSDELHREILASYRYVSSVIKNGNASPLGHTWHGWAMREAFLAGCSFAARNGRCSVKPLSTAAIDQLIDAVEHPSEDQG